MTGPEPLTAEQLDILRRVLRELAALQNPPSTTTETSDT